MKKSFTEVVKDLLILYVSIIVAAYVIMGFIQWDINWLGFGRVQGEFPYMNNTADYLGRRFMFRVCIALWALILTASHWPYIYKAYTSKQDS